MWTTRHTMHLPDSSDTVRLVHETPNGKPPTRSHVLPSSVVSLEYVPTTPEDSVDGFVSLPDSPTIQLQSIPILGHPGIAIPRTIDETIPMKTVHEIGHPEPIVAHIEAHLQACPTIGWRADRPLDCVHRSPQTRPPDTSCTPPQSSPHERVWSVVWWFRWWVRWWVRWWFR